MALPTDVIITAQQPFTPYLNLSIAQKNLTSSVAFSLSAKATVSALPGPKWVSCFGYLPDNVTTWTAALVFNRKIGGNILTLPVTFVPLPQSGGSPQSGNPTGLVFSAQGATTSGTFSSVFHPVIQFGFTTLVSKTFESFDMQSYPINFDFDTVDLNMTVIDTNPAGGTIEIDCGVAVISI